MDDARVILFVVFLIASVLAYLAVRWMKQVAKEMALNEIMKIRELEEAAIKRERRAQLLEDFLKKAGEKL